MITVLTQRIEVLRLTKETGEKTRESLSDRQKEAVLRAQLRQIRQQLGETDEGGAQASNLAQKIDQAGMPAEVEEQAGRELRRLERSLRLLPSTQ